MKKVKVKVLTIILSVILVFASLSGTLIFANANTETNTGTTAKTVATVKTTKPVHVHKCKWVTTKKATLKKTGKKVYKCTSCGKITKTAKIAKLKKLSTPKITKVSTKCVKTSTGEDYLMLPKVTVKWNKVKNATGYEIYYKEESWKNYKTKTVDTNSYTFTSFGTIAETEKRFVKVVAITDKKGYVDSSASKVKTIKMKPIKVIKECPKCHWKQGEGKGYCETFVGEGYCFHCGKFVPRDTCHHCTVSNKSKEFWKYDYDTGKAMW